MTTAFRHRFDARPTSPEALSAIRAPAMQAAASSSEVPRMLKSRGLKVTLSRIQVLTAVHDNTLGGECLTSDEIYQAVARAGGDMALTQICTNLAMLVEADLVERYKLGEGRTLFSLKHGPRWSAFLVCTVCHSTAGVRNTALDTLLAEMAAVQQLHEPEPTVVLRGQCAACAPRAWRIS